MLFIIQLAGLAPCRWCPLNSHVRHRSHALTVDHLKEDVPRLMTTVQTRQLAAWLAFATCVLSAQAANSVHKCVVDGRVTFQNSPCATEKPSRQPTVEELNIARKKRLSEPAAQAPSSSSTAPSTVPSESRPLDASQSPTPARASAYRCDGRTHCSQMRSCSEAKFFLANCPGVKMDGNHDGTPCEQQWCTHPLAK